MGVTSEKFLLANDGRHSGCGQDAILPYQHTCNAGSCGHAQNNLDSLCVPESEVRGNEGMTWEDGRMGE